MCPGKPINYVSICMYRLFIKSLVNAPEYIVELHKHAGIFENTREVRREARGVAECFSHFSSVLNPILPGLLFRS